MLFGALLHDMGKIVTDLRVDMIERPGAEPRRWLPLSGTLAAAGAAAYRVGFAPKSERDYGAHRKLPLALLQRIVPATALAFPSNCRLSRPSWISVPSWARHSPASTSAVSKDRRAE